ncbi:hypothetical protein C2134_16690 [Chromobacterium sinusclupearum]|uniref:DUF4239 domain-containing protein n=1 Tax=Chromobacterium sinusclupearum TaxID=2077146 RepID=A0A2K4MK72_9NEIS|nr:DUF4239 domain-containing protein [Chromobacterium sinusclupearum]POA97463.1 hypothetical protein C2134_16690 [Chromobacterium sinusclupearum]
MSLFDVFNALPSTTQIYVGSLHGLLLTACVGLLLRPLRPWLEHDKNDELGVIIAVIGVFYGLIIAALLMRAIAHFDIASEAVEQEAQVSTSFYRAALNGDAALAPQLKPPLLNYLRTVVEKEAPQQMNGAILSMQSEELAQISAALRNIHPDTAGQLAAKQQASQQLESLYAARHARLSHQTMAVPPEAWIISLIGEVLIVVLAWLLHFSRPALQFVMIAALAVSISITLVVILIYDTPYLADEQVAVNYGAYRQAMAAIANDSLQY